VPELQPGACTVRLDEPGDPPVRRDLGVVPQAEIAVGDATARLHRRGLGEHDPCAAGGEPAEMYQMPVVGHAVLGRVLAHRRDHDAVGRAHAAQVDRREQQGTSGAGGQG
jgi:hypothetical protein